MTKQFPTISAVYTHPVKLKRYPVQGDMVTVKCPYVSDEHLRDKIFKIENVDYSPDTPPNYKIVIQEDAPCALKYGPPFGLVKGDYLIVHADQMIFYEPPPPKPEPSTHYPTTAGEIAKLLEE